MKESYREGAAIHPDPESCEGGREAALEALTGAYVGAVLSSEIRRCGVPTVSGHPEGNTAPSVRRAWPGPAESKTRCMHRSSMRENRETPLLPVAVRCGPVGEGDEL